MKRPKHYGRWRAATLIGLYCLMVAHVVHWKMAGRTLAPLELNEVMYTIELGIITAGFLFMLVAFVSAAIVGRFFCSWGCHIMALEDGSAWLLKKLGIRPVAVRSRALLLVPSAAAFYMLVWPTLKRMAAGGPAPTLKIFSDSQGWASFVTENMWRNLPGPWVALLTLSICGFAVVYFLGSRGFCTYACPYGVVFGLADRVAPGKIAAVGECTECGSCTAACQSYVRVHEELKMYGRVVNTACMKDLDCVAACPNDNIAFKFTKPSFFASWRKLGRFGVPYDFTLAEDLIMAGVFLGTIFVFRGLYEAVPFLLTLGLGGVLAYITIVATRLLRAPDVRLNRYLLKRAGRLLPAGRAFASFVVVLALFTAHSAYIRYHEWQGQIAYEKAEPAIQRGEAPNGELFASALTHLQTCVQWGLIRPASLDRRLAMLYLSRNETALAEAHVRRVAEKQPEDGDWGITFAAVLLTTGKPDEAIRQLNSVVSSSVVTESARAAARTMLAEIRAAQDQAAN